MRRFSVMLMALFLVSGLIAIPAYAANEKGPRCSDEIDNDGDGAIDSEDSDCGGGSGANLPQVVDSQGTQVGLFSDWGDTRPAIYIRLPNGKLAEMDVLPNELVFDNLSESIYYASDDCSGNPYIFPWEPETILPIELNLTRRGSDYFVGDGITVPFTPGSIFVDSQSQCFNENDGYIFGEGFYQLATLIDPGLDRYVPPFELKLPEF